MVEPKARHEFLGMNVQVYGLGTCRLSVTAKRAAVNREVMGSTPIGEAGFFAVKGYPRRDSNSESSAP
eukprot:scaffold84030_cov42-Phaeocystis_antarctica.AAC.1